MDKQVCDPFLKTGMMLASLKSVGTVPVENEVLKRISNGLEITDFRSLSMSMGILKGPTALPLLRLHNYYIFYFGGCGGRNKKAVALW